MRRPPGYHPTQTVEGVAFKLLRWRLARSLARQSGRGPTESNRMEIQSEFGGNASTHAPTLEENQHFELKVSNK